MTRPLLAFVASLAFAAVGAANAHATLVLGEVTLSPDPPVPGEPLLVRVTLADPSMAPVEDAVVLIEVREHDPGAAEVRPGATEASDLPPPAIEVALAETAPAVYEATIVLASEGSYHLLIRDRTFEWEEANASVLLDLDGSGVGTLPFILPPTAIGPRSLWTWLIWLVGLPIVAGLVVTVLVLTSKKESS